MLSSGVLFSNKGQIGSKGYELIQKGLKWAQKEPQWSMVQKGANRDNKLSKGYKRSQKGLLGTKRDKQVLFLMVPQSNMGKWI